MVALRTSSFSHLADEATMRQLIVWLLLGKHCANTNINGNGDGGPVKEWRG